MTRSTLLAGVAGAFAAMASLMVVLVPVYRTPVPLVLAVPFGMTAYVMWYGGNGPFDRWLRDRTARRRRHRPPDGGRMGAGSRRQSTGADRSTGRTRPAQSRVEAARVLGVDPGADQSTIKAAYRRRASDTHPDAPAGSKVAFKRVTDAYDRLRE